MILQNRIFHGLAMPFHSSDRDEVVSDREIVQLKKDSCYFAISCMYAYFI